MGIFSNFKEPIQNIVRLDREFPFITSLKGSPVYRKMFQSHSQKSAIFPFDKSTENVKNVSKKGKKKAFWFAKWFTIHIKNILVSFSKTFEIQKPPCSAIT